MCVEQSAASIQLYTYMYIALRVICYLNISRDRKPLENEMMHVKRFILM